VKQMIILMLLCHMLVYGPNAGNVLVQCQLENDNLLNKRTREKVSCHPIWNLWTFRQRWWLCMVRWVSHWGQVGPSISKQTYLKSTAWCRRTCIT